MATLTYEKYSAMTSADCAMEFKSAIGMVQWFGYLLAGMMTPYVGALNSVFPIKNYIELTMTRLDGFYHCASMGGEAGFDLSDGTWDQQKGYLNLQLAKLTAFEYIPLYGIFLLVTTGFGLAGDFGSLVEAMA